VRSILSVLITMAVAIPAAAQQAPAKRIWDGVFNSTQAQRGKAAFELSCARCHNVALTGSERGPAIKGQTFLSHWEKDSLAGLFKKIRDTMPEGGSGTVKDEVKIDIVSYILQQNGFPAGGEELKLDLPSLEDIALARKGIWDGVYTKAQAERGKAALLKNGCNGCHGAELAGDRGPALKGERFLTDWENGPADRLFVKIRETMPPLNAQQVPPAEKVDIVAYLLEVNGFPSGSTALGMDDLQNIQIVKRGAETAGPPNFSLVEIIGCLTSAENRKWALTAATEPVPTKEESSTPAALTSAKNRAPGRGTFELISVGPSLNAEAQKNHKVDARGLLYREDGYAALNVTSLETVSAACN
jgi:mono/diheme cytochrome c family protein